MDGTVTALRVTGRLEPVDAAPVALARTLADQIDAEVLAPDGSAYTVGTLSGRLLDVLRLLYGLVPPGGDDLDAEHVALVAAVRDATRPPASDTST